MEPAETNTSKVTFEGLYDDAFALVEQLRTAGIAVTWTPPDHERGSIVQDIIVGLVVNGTVQSVRSVVSHFVEQHRAKINLEPPDPDDSKPELES